MDWDDAKCKGLPPEVFFPEIPNGGRPSTRIDKKDKTLRRTTDDAQHEVARLHCRGGDGMGECPIRLDCLEWALENKEDSGVWGGYTENGRINLRRRRYRRRAA